MTENDESRVNGESWVIVYRIDNVNVEKIVTWWNEAWSQDGPGAPLEHIQDKELPYQVALEVSDGGGEPRAYCAALFTGKQPPQDAIVWLSKLWSVADAGTPVLMENTVSRVLTGTIGWYVDPVELGRHIIVKPLSS
ncbi:hypothetical protein ACFRAU_14485 [Arthrobacter sp. NPDC056691]|uniref:hypothetical protein n=1 Tax=Arthrobacter sp. NPDC056691 TaxID=3345913 RepID=UPI0036703706